MFWNLLSCKRKTRFGIKKIYSIVSAIGIIITIVCAMLLIL